MLFSPQFAAKDIPKQLDGIFVFSLIWSLGATTDADGRTRFSEFLRKLLEGSVDKKADRTDFDLGPGLEIVEPSFKLGMLPPKEGLVYDYCWDKERGVWKHWLETVTVSGVKFACVLHAHAHSSTHVISNTRPKTSRTFLITLCWACG